MIHHAPGLKIQRNANHNHNASGESSKPVCPSNDMVYGDTTKYPNRNAHNTGSINMIVSSQIVHENRIKKVLMMQMISSRVELQGDSRQVTATGGVH